MNLSLNFSTNMKILSKNFLLFIASALIIISTSRVLLSYFLAVNNNIIVIIVAIGWFLSLFISGWYFGKKDAENLPFYKSGYRFHLAT